MKNLRTLFLTIAFISFSVEVCSQVAKAINPIIHADVPDAAIIRVGDNYYMSSTTMHMNPGVPIMKSTDLVNWKLLNYAYDTLAETPELTLSDNKNTYGKGSWASSIRYHKGIYYVSTFAQTTGQTYIFKTTDIEKGNWERVSFSPSYHDHSLFFDYDEKAYLVYGGEQIKLVELKDDLSGPAPDVDEITIIDKASSPAGLNMMLGAEGSQLFKINNRYYLFNICWPRNGMRTVIIHRSNSLMGPWEGKVGLQDLGVAQGGLIDTPDGKWFSYLFRDYGAVGRIPYLVPVTWENGWPILGVNGKVPMSLDLPANKSLIGSIVDNDEFTRKQGDAILPLAWQWNHNPDNTLWSVSERKGFLRLKTGRLDTDILQARNILLQRTFGPTSSASIALDVTKLKEGDFAGLTAFQADYGVVGVKLENGKKYIYMKSALKGVTTEKEAIALKQNNVYFKIDCDFTERKDEAKFYYSLDGKTWEGIGETLKMSYTIPHFMGYRFGLYNYATKEVGGYADFDWYRITN